MDEAEAVITAIVKDGAEVDALNAGDEGQIILNQTPFYGESGGQVGDQGTLTSGSARFAVADTLKIKADVFGHHGQLDRKSVV